MRTTFASPRSISTLKSFADKLRKSSTTPITQVAALQAVARQFGYANYAHAQRSLPEKMRPLALRCRWREGSSEGAEEISYPLPWTAAQIEAMQLKAGRIADFKTLDGALRCSTTASDRYAARYWLVQALRELMVMDATGLRPSFVANHLPKKRNEHRGVIDYERVSPPGSDHLSAWYDPAKKTALFMDEPYLARGEPHSRATDRAAWCKRYGFREIASNWGGTYLPPESRLFMLAKSDGGIDLAEIEAKLASLPDDFGSSEADWKGTSLETPPAS